MFVCSDSAYTHKQFQYKPYGSWTAHNTEFVVKIQKKAQEDSDKLLERASREIWLSDPPGKQRADWRPLCEIAPLTFPTTPTIVFDGDDDDDSENKHCVLADTFSTCSVSEPLLRQHQRTDMWTLSVVDNIRGP